MARRSNGRVKLNMAAIQRVLKSPEVQSEVDSIAKRYADRAGAGFEAVSRPHKFTSRAYVQTVGRKGAVRQARESVLQSVFGGKIEYTTSKGKKIWATKAQIEHWTRGKS